jgi:adenylate cyclase
LKRIRLSALVFGLVCASGLLAIRIADPFLTRTLREASFDQLQRLMPRATSDLPVRIVDIDEASLAAFGQWPWRRDQLAELVRRLHHLGAAVIAFDVLFVEPDRFSADRRGQDWRASAGAAQAGRAASGAAGDNDRTFADSMREARVVLGFGVLPHGGAASPAVKATFAFTGDDPIGAPPRLAAATRNVPDIDAAAAGVGRLNVSPLDTGGVLRRVPLLWTDGAHFYPSLALEALRVA